MNTSLQGPSVTLVGRDWASAKATPVAVPTLPGSVVANDCNCRASEVASEAPARFAAGAVFARRARAGG
jgi:hypothetical protein